MPLESCTGGHGASKSSRDQKTVDYSPRNGQKCSKSRVLTIPLESCTGGSRGIEILPGPETVDYSPRKWPQMLEIMSFYDAASVMYRGHGVSKSSRDPKIVD